MTGKRVPEIRVLLYVGYLLASLFVIIKVGLGKRVPDFLDLLFPCEQQFLLLGSEGLKEKREFSNVKGP